jgi:hypothetical protein
MIEKFELKKNKNFNLNAILKNHLIEGLNEIY